MPYGSWWIYFEDIIVPHADKDGFPAIQAAGVDTNLRTGEEPAHGQRFEPSLAVPLLFPIDCHEIMGRYIGKRRPRLDIIRVFDKPAGYGGLGCFTLQQLGLFRWHA